MSDAERETGAGRVNVVDATAATSAAAFDVSYSAAQTLVAEEYNFNHARRGKAIIINNKEFDERLTNQLERIGTEVDGEKLTNTFMDLGFEVEVFNNLTSTEMSLTLATIAQEDHSDADCFVCAILSHGIEGRVYGTNGTVTIASLTQKFKGDNCLSLAGKPKIFFVQACRGVKYDEGVDMVDAKIDADTEEDPVVRKIPAEADFLMAYSVVPGYFSWRNSVDGSWFIQAICRVFKEHYQQMELLQMMTLVNKVVAFEFASCTDSEFIDKMKQVPCIVSMLTKSVYFHPKY